MLCKRGSECMLLLQSLFGVLGGCCGTGLGGSIGGEDEGFLGAHLSLQGRDPRNGLGQSGAISMQAEAQRYRYEKHSR